MEDWEKAFELKEISPRMIKEKHQNFAFETSPTQENKSKKSSNVLYFLNSLSQQIEKLNISSTNDEELKRLRQKLNECLEYWCIDYEENLPIKIEEKKIEFENETNHYHKARHKDSLEELKQIEKLSQEINKVIVSLLNEDCIQQIKQNSKNYQKTKKINEINDLIKDLQSLPLSAEKIIIELIVYYEDRLCFLVWLGFYVVLELIWNPKDPRLEPGPWRCWV